MLYPTELRAPAAVIVTGLTVVGNELRDFGKPMPTRVADSGLPD
ncbi:hypothetical protein [Rubripirellula tenax]|nr:hypothetical protein [Rubripirellula tenax]